MQRTRQICWRECLDHFTSCVEVSSETKTTFAHCQPLPNKPGRRSEMTFILDSNQTERENR